MAGLVIPLGLDTKNFEDAFKKVEKQIGGMMNFLDASSSKSTKSVELLNSNYEKANVKASEFAGTTEKIRHAMGAIETITGSINLNTAKGQQQLSANYNEWVKLRTVIGDSNVSFEKLYRMQQEYQKLTGKDYKIGNLKDARNLEKLIEQEKEIARIKEQQAKNDKSNAAYQARVQRDRLTAEQNRIAREQLAKQRAIESDRVSSRNIKRADKLTSDAMRMEAATADQLRAKIDALTAAKGKLNLKNEAGRKKYSEVEREIRRNERALQDLKKRKDELSSITGGLGKKLMAAFSIQMISQFARNVITVGGELEKQRVALGSIVGDISKANILFSQLKQQALESPFTFRHIIAGTRQLAAFNIETEKLYDTQYMLSELSAGLGVQVSRLILAYGQVRAAAVLRGQELRQFTEAGIPIIDALAKKFTELEGRVVSTAEVFEKVSERLVPFQMVHEVLKEMTDEGGKFFGMQKKMADTVAGQWVNVGDAIDQMYMEIANEQEGFIMKVIKMFRYLITNWRTFEKAMYAAAAAYAGYLIFSATYHAANLKFLGSYNKLLVTKTALIKGAKAAMLGFIGIAAIGLTMLIGYLWNMSQEANRFRKSMADIAGRHGQSVDQESDSLKTLIKQLENATEGTENYKKIKDKIASQYGQYLPFLIDEHATVKDIADAYDYATTSMKAYYAEKALEEMSHKTQEDSGVKKRADEVTEAARKALVGQGVGDSDAVRIATIFTQRLKEMELAGEEIGDVFEHLQDIAIEFGETVEKKTGGLDWEHSVGHRTSVMLRKFKQVYKDLADVHRATFNDLAPFIEKSLNDAQQAYEIGMSKIEGEIEFSPLDNILRKQDAEKRKKGAEIVARELQAVYLDAVKSIKGGANAQSVKAIQDEFSGYITETFNGASINDVAAKVSQRFGEFGKQAAMKMQQSMESQLNGSGTSVSKSILEYFKGLNKEIIDQKSASNQNDEAIKESIKIQEDSAKTIYNLASGYVSLKNAMQLFDTIKEQKETLRIETQYMNSLDESIKKLIPNTEEYARKLAMLNLQKKEVAKWAQNIKILENLVKFLGITEPEKEKKEPKGENPELEKARKLVQIYKELNQAYEKYAEYRTEEFARNQSMSEFQKEYNELRKSLGNKIPELTAIRSQKELASALEKTLNSTAFRTPKGRSIVETALLGVKGGQIVKESKDAFEDVKKKAEQILERIVVGVNSDEMIYQINDIIAGLNAYGEEGKKLALDLEVRVDKEKVKSQLKLIDDELQNVKDKYALGKEFTTMQEQFAFNMPDMFNDKLMNYEDYINKLYEIRDRYVRMGASGVEKAGEISMFITKEKFDNIKGLYQEAFKLQYELMDNAEKVDKIEERIYGLNAKREILQATVDVIRVDDESETAFNRGSAPDLSDAEKEALENYKAQLKYLNALIDSLKKQKEDLQQDVFRTSEMYKALYGDIEKWGTTAYREILKAIEDAMKAGKVENKGTKDEKWIVKDPFSGKDVEYNAKQYGNALNDIAKKQRSLKNSNPWVRIGEDLKKVRETLKIGESESIVINFENLGKALEGIGSQIQGLGNIAESLGFGQQTQDYINGVAGGIGSIGRIIASGGLDIGAWADLIKNYVLVMDADNRERIANYEKQVQSLEKQYDAIKSKLEDTAGIDAYNEKYKESLDLIKQVKDNYIKMAMEEKNKKGTDKKTYEDLLAKAEEQDKKYRDELKSTIEEWSTSITDASQSFADAWVEAFVSVGDGFSTIEDSFEKMMRRIASKQIQQAFISVALKPLIDQINKAVDPTNLEEGGIMITERESAWIRDAKNLSFNMMESFQPMIDELLKSLGIGGGGFEYDTLQKGIQGITENTAQIIASYMNSVRLEVTNIRMIMQKRSGGTTSQDPTAQMSEAILTYYPQYLDNLIAIREHTSYLKDAYSPTARGFRMA